MLERPVREASAFQIVTTRALDASVSWSPRDRVMLIRAIAAIGASWFHRLAALACIAAPQYSEPLVTATTMHAEILAEMSKRLHELVTL
jgi:hypothetical protein